MTILILMCMTMLVPAPSCLAATEPQGTRDDARGVQRGDLLPPELPEDGLTLLHGRTREWGCFAAIPGLPRDKNNGLLALRLVVYPCRTEDGRRADDK